MKTIEGIQVEHTFHSLNRGRDALASGVDETREDLAALGAEDGLAVVPIRSVLGLDLVRQAHLGYFSNRKDGVQLIGAVYQPYGPTVPDAVRRFRDRGETDMSNPERLKRLGMNLAERVVMPPRKRSLGAMHRWARHARRGEGGEQLFSRVYVDPDQPEVRFIEDHPLATAVEPEVVRTLGVSDDMARLPYELGKRGIRHLVFDPYHASRKTQDGENVLSSWETYLPALAPHVRALDLSLDRDDLTPASGQAAGAETKRLLDLLVRGDINPSQLGALPEQIDCIVRAHTGEHPLAITLVGRRLGQLPTQAVATVYHNLDSLIRASARDRK